MTSKLKVAHISGHGCVRAHKMALAQMMDGTKVHFIVGQNGGHLESYNSVALAQDLDQLSESIRIYSKEVDIFHVHNEPSYYVSLVKEVCNVPVVLDVHDSYLARITPVEHDKMMEEGRFQLRISIEERNNFQLADALVFPSQSFGDLICNEFSLKQPRLILPGYVPKMFYHYDIREWMGGLVYEGKVNLPTELTHGAGAGFRYCDYLELAKKARELKLDFHLYAGRNGKDFKEAYNKIAVVHHPQLYGDLIKCLSRHDWGLVGNLGSSPEWDVAMPNKLFEYVAAGTPIVAMNAPECEKFILEHGIGISVKSIEELAERWSEHRTCRNKLLKVRKKFSMENYTQDLYDLYNTVMDPYTKFKETTEHETLKSILVGVNGDNNNGK